MGVGEKENKARKPDRLISSVKSLMLLNIGVLVGPNYNPLYGVYWTLCHAEMKFMSCIFSGKKILLMLEEKAIHKWLIWKVLIDLNLSMELLLHVSYYFDNK